MAGWPGKGRCMTHRFGTISAVFLLVYVVLCGPAAAQQSGSAEKGRRLLDVEAAVGAIVAVGNNPPVDNNLLYGASVAVRIIDRLDGELGLLFGDTKDRDSEDHQLVKYLYGGVRWYPLFGRFFPVDGAARPYLLMGVTEYWDLEDSDEDTGLIFGPGIRFQPGENFGFTLKLPVVVAVTGGDSNWMMLPNFNLYWQFDLPGGGGAPAS
jgi:hypothetical protein